MLHVTVLAEVASTNFERSMLFFLQKGLKFNIVANGEKFNSLLLSESLFFSKQSFCKCTCTLWQASQRYWLGFWNFNLRNIAIFTTWDPMRGKFSKRHSSYSYDSFLTKLFLNFPCHGSHKSFPVEILKLHISFVWKRRLKFYIVVNGKMRNCQYLGNG